MRKSGERQVWEYVFGKSQEELDLEQKIADNKRASRYSRGKLGQTIRFETEEYDSYAARFIMGDQVRMYAVIDTATEITVANSSLCTKCGDQVYDPTQAIEDG